MLCREIVIEKIVSNPRNLSAYLTARMKLIASIRPVVEQAVATIKQHLHDGEYLVRYALGHIMGDRPMLPDAYQVDLNRLYKLEDLSYSLGSIVQFGPSQFLKFAVNQYDYMSPMDAETRALLALMPQVETGFAEYGYTDPSTHDDEYHAARALADAYIAIAKVLEKLDPMLADLKAKLLHIEKRLNYNYQPEKYRPDHQEVETLYHASIFANEIVAQGFSAEKPEGRRGVGNFGDQDSISFTHDIRIAHDIMRALREMCLIVHGQLTRREILKWMHHEGIDVERASYLYMRAGDPNTIENIIALYRGYIGLTKLRADPAFVSPEYLIPLLKTKQPNDIGIVSCDVRLDGEESYHHGEAEFRVSASRVVGPIKRVI